MLEEIKARPVLGIALTKKIFLGLFSCACVVSLSSHSVASEAPLTLKQALKRTLDFNPSLKVYDFKTQALQGNIKTAQLNPAYQLGFDLDNMMGSGDFSGLSRSELTISLSSMIELGDKRVSRVQVVDSQQSLVQAQREAASLDLLGLTTRRYIDVLSAQAFTDLALEALALAKSSYLLVNERVKAGATPELEVKRAHTVVVQAELNHLAEQKKLNLAKIILANSWGRHDIDFSQLEGSLYQFSQDIAFETLYAKIENNPVIQLLAAKKRVKASEYRLAKVQSKLDVNWQVGLRRFEETGNSALVAGLSIPLYSSKRNSGLIASSKAEADQIAILKEVDLLSLYTQLHRAFTYRQQALLTVKQFQEVIVPELKQVLKDTESAYQNGLYSYLEYITSRQELLSARKVLIESATAGLKYGLEIEQLIAEPLSAVVDSKNKI